MLRCPRTTAAVCFLLFGFLVAGCGSPPTPEPPTPTARTLVDLGSAYVHATTRLKRPPANLEELKPDLDKQGAGKDLLHSPNDGEAFVIVWGVELRALKARGSDIPIVAYEKTGKDGIRYVLRGRAEVLQLTAGELKSAKFPDGYTFPF